MTFGTGVAIAISSAIGVFVCIPVCKCYLEILNGNIALRPKGCLSEKEQTQQV
jgi:hypothetical protein